MTLGYHLTPVRMTKIKIMRTAYVEEDVELGEDSSTRWQWKLVQPLWKSVWCFLRKLGISLPQDPAIQLLGVFCLFVVVVVWFCKVA